MTKQYNCKEITSKLNLIKEKKIRFDQQSLHEVVSSFDMKELKTMVNEVLEILDPWEVKKRDSLAKKYGASYVSTFTDDNFAYARLTNGENILVRRNGERLNDKKYDSIMTTVSGLVSVSIEKEGKEYQQVVNLSTGKEIFNLSFSEQEVKRQINLLDNGIIQVINMPDHAQPDRQISYFDKSGRRLFTELNYLDSAYGITDDRKNICVKKIDDNWYAIDCMTGKEKRLGKYEKVTLLKNDFLVTEDQKRTLLNKDGHILYDNILEYASSSMSDFYYKLMFSDWTENLLDENNELVLPVNYQKVGLFREGLVWVRDWGVWKVVNRKGDVVFEDPIGISIHKNASNQGQDYPYFTAGLCRVRSAKEGVEETYVLDRTGHVVLRGAFTGSYIYDEGLISTSDGRESYIYNQKGEKIAGPYSSFGLIDPKEKLFYGIREGKRYFLDKSGNTVAGPYDSVSYQFTNGWIGVQKYGVWYLMNDEGEISLNDKYPDGFERDPSNFMCGVVEVKYNKQIFYIDERGNKVFNHGGRGDE